MRILKLLRRRFNSGGREASGFPFQLSLFIAGMRCNHPPSVRTPIESTPHTEVAHKSIRAGCQALHVHGRTHEQHLHFGVVRALSVQASTPFEDSRTA